MKFQRLKFVAELDDDNRFVWELDQTDNVWKAWRERDQAWKYEEMIERKSILDAPTVKIVMQRIAELSPNS